MAGPCCSLRRRSGSASSSSPRSRSGYPSSAAPSEILRDIPRDHGDAAEDSHQSHDLRHGTAEPNLATHHEALEILLAFPELGPGVVGPFELEVRGNVGGDRGGRDSAVHDVDQEGGLAVDARQDDFRRDGRGFPGPFGIRVEAIRHLLEKGLSEVLRQRFRSCGTVLDEISLCETGRRASAEREKVLRPRTSRELRVGSQARSKARDSRSLPEGVPRFESWPTHRTHPYLWASGE